MSTNATSTAPVHVEASIESSGTTRVKDYLIGFAFVIILGLIGVAYQDLRGRILEAEARERERDRQAQDSKVALLEKLAAQDKENARRGQQLDDLGKEMHEMRSDVHDIKVELTRRRVP